MVAPSEVKTLKGFATVFFTGFFGALVALGIAQVFPTIIPARATGVNL